MRARSWLLHVLAALPACSFAPGSPGLAIDGAVSTDGDAPACTSFSSQLDTCGVATSSDTLTLSGEYTYDTTQGTLKSAGGNVTITRMQVTGKAGPIEVWLVGDLHATSGARLRAIGNVPLAIVAFNAITIDANATLDVSAGGAGARVTCTG